jgi:hypothetical protein
MSGCNIGAAPAHVTTLRAAGSATHGIAVDAVESFREQEGITRVDWKAKNRRLPASSGTAFRET